jgi:hypothetical protein
MKQAHDILEGIMADVDDDLAHRRIENATIGSIASIFAHTVYDEDLILNGVIQGRPPLYAAGGWAQKCGVEMRDDPLQTPAWAAKVKLTPAFRDYARAVYAATDAYIAGVSDEDLSRIVQTPFGQQPATAALSLGVYHFAQHSGEIAAIKGVTGRKGLPF